MQRADLNAALVRQSCGHFKKTPKLGDLLIQYGAKPKRKTDAELLEAGRAWSARKK